MNYKMIKYILGIVLKVEGFLMLLPVFVGLLYSESESYTYIICSVICLIIGFLMSYKKPDNVIFFAIEGYVTVALSWILLSFFGSLPFVLTGEIPYLPDALFETISGFTTTGASILSDVENLSYTTLFWRSFTHWIGGMGVLVFILTIIPLKTGSNVFLMKAESPGPEVEKLVPTIRNTSLILYGIYSLMTIIEIILLVATGMPIFDAVTVSFGTAGTGGFSIKNSGLALYAPHLQNIVTVFMILFGVNFNVYYLILAGRYRAALKHEELRAYLSIIFVSIAIITVYILNSCTGFADALCKSAFQVASIITTTGFSTCDFDLWHSVPKTILITLMFIGACAGSTGGGIKVSRIVILIKSIGKEIYSFVHPHSVRKIKMDGHTIEHQTLRSINIFFAVYALIFVISVIIIAIDGYDFNTNFTAVAATFNNIGPGFGLVGPSSNFGHFSTLSKFVLMFDMLAGRLEIFPLLALFSFHTYKKC